MKRLLLCFILLSTVLFGQRADRWTIDTHNVIVPYILNNQVAVGGTAFGNYIFTVNGKSYFTDTVRIPYLIAGSVKLSGNVSFDTVTGGVWKGSPIADVYIASHVNWNIAYSAAHFHDNKAKLDSIAFNAGTINGITSALISSWNNKQNALGYTPVRDSTTLTINGVTHDLTTNRSWYISPADSAIFATRYYVNNQGFLKSYTVDSTLFSTHYYVNNQGFLKIVDTTKFATHYYVNNQGFLKSVDTTKFSTHYYTNSQGFLKAGDITGKINYADTTSLVATQHYVNSQGFLKVSYADTVNVIATHHYVNSQGFLKTETDPLSVHVAGHTFGDILYSDNTGNIATLHGNTTSTQLFLTQTGDGVNSAAPSWQPVSVGGTLSYYLTDTASAVVGEKKLKTDPVLTKLTYTTSGLSVGNTLLQTWVTEPSVPGLSFIPAGQFELHIHASQSAGTNTSVVYGEIWEVNSSGVDIAKIGTSAVSGILTGTETEYRLFFTTSDVYNLSSVSSRVEVKVYTVVVGVGTQPTVVLYYGGEADSHLTMPAFTIDAFSFLPYTGATANVNLGPYNITAANLAVSNWNTAFSQTHTHANKTKLDSLTTASASVLNNITSTLVTSWNNKQAALVSGTNIKTINSNSLLGSGNITVATLIGYTPYNSTNPSNYITLTGLSSSTAALTYVNTTGVFSVTSGYTIPFDTSITH